MSRKTQEQITRAARKRLIPATVLPRGTRTRTPNVVRLTLGCISKGRFMKKATAASPGDSSQTGRHLTGTTRHLDRRATRTAATPSPPEEEA